MAWLAAFLGACMLLLAPGVARSAECADRYRITFADGTRSCLTDHALANDDVVGQFGADVHRLVPSGGAYSLAATPHRPQCKRAVGMDRLTSGLQATALAADSAQRSEKALQDCRLRARGAAPDCRCRVVLVDGRSPLTAAEFAQYADPAAGAPVPLAAASAAVSAAPVGGMLPPAAAAGGRAAGVPPSSDELAALRQEIEALRAQMAAARPAANSPESPVRQPRRARALVIGNSRYAHLGLLPNPQRDAEAIAAKLRSFGVEVDLHLDLDRPNLVRALTAFQSRAAGAEVNLLFYAGHGLQVAGINYIVPVDMQTDGATVGSVKLNGVSLDDALDYLPAATRVVFLDACRDNPISRSLRATRSGVGLGLAPVSSVSGTLLSYATRDGSTAEDGTGGNSPYTAALLQHLDAEEDIALVLRRVRQAVLQATAQRQEPWEYGSLVGDQLVLSRLAR